MYRILSFEPIARFIKSFVCGTHNITNLVLPFHRHCFVAASVFHNFANK